MTRCRTRPQHAHRAARRQQALLTALLAIFLLTAFPAHVSAQDPGVTEESGPPPSPAEANWYAPTAEDTQRRPAQPEPTPLLDALFLEIPLYSYLAYLEGVGSSVRVRGDSDWFGGYLGLHQPSNFVDIGLDLNVLGGTRLVTVANMVDVWLVYPSLGWQVVTDFDAFNIGMNINLTGLRATHCLSGSLCLIGDISGPRLGGLLNFSAKTAAAYWGVTFAAGVGL